MLDLNARVHLEEEERCVVAFAVNQELDRAGAVIANGLSGGHRGGAHAFAEPRRQGWRWGFLDDLLVAPLDRTLAFEQVHDGAVLIAEHLDLDVARRREVPLDEHGAVTERRRSFALCALDCRGQFGRGLDDAHALAATTGRGLDQYRHLELTEVRGSLAVDQDLREGRHVGVDHHRLGRELVAHRRDRIGRRADPGHAGRFDRTSEVGVFSQEPVARMHRVGAGATSGIEHLVDVEIALCRGAAVERNGLPRLSHERCVGVAVGEDGNGVNTHVVGGPEHTPGDLTPVRHQQSADHETLLAMSLVSEAN